MKYYKSETNKLYAYAKDGLQDAYIKPNLVAITDAEVEAIRNPPLTPEQIQAKAYQEWKNQRSIAVDNIEVEYNGVIYQGDETSQDRLSRAILALQDDTTTTTWIAKDNSVHQLNSVDLKAILALSGSEQSRLWNLGRP